MVSGNEHATRGQEDSILTPHELATYLKISEKTLYRLAQRAELPGFKVGGAWRFRKGDIDRWIEGQTPSDWSHHRQQPVDAEQANNERNETDMP